MNRRKLLARLARGAVANVAFTDLQNLVESFGFDSGESAGVITSMRIRT